MLDCNAFIPCKYYSSKYYYTLKPETIISLDLSNSKIDLEKTSKFVNLEYLSLKDDHLKELPKELFLLKKLKHWI
jgi:Leucine-rich repeat (LRR) protein